MDELVKTVATQVPGLIVLAWMVSKFLTHLKEGRKHDKAIADDCHNVIVETNSAIRENSVVLGKNIEVMQNVKEVVQNCARRVGT